MDDIGFVITPVGDIVTVILVVNSNVGGFFMLKYGVTEVCSTLDSLGSSTQGGGHVD